MRGALPGVLTGLRIGFGWTTLAAAGMVAAGAVPPFSGVA